MALLDKWNGLLSGAKLVGFAADVDKRFPAGFALAYYLIGASINPSNLMLCSYALLRHVFGVNNHACFENAQLLDQNSDFSEALD